MIWFSLTSLIFMVIGFLILYRITICKNYEYPSSSIPSISIIIPARNEEYNLPTLLSSLKVQTLTPDEVIVVDDNSEDNTAAIAKKHNARLISSSSLPKGWYGKPWSCYSGAQEARGDIFIFLDADTFLEPDGLQKMVSTFLRSKGVISILPYHKIEKFHETFSAFFNIMQLIGMNYFSIFKNKSTIGMFGPCLVISRKDYLTAGGHKAVKGEILEHYIFATVLNKHNIPIELFSGKGSLNVRMYSEGWKSLIQGWSKSFISGADQTPKWTFRLSIMWISGLILTPSFLLISILLVNTIWITIWVILYILYVIQLFIQFRRAGNFPFWSSVFYPLNLIFFLTVFSYAAYMGSNKKNIYWKGRNIKI